MLIKCHPNGTSDGDMSCVIEKARTHSHIEPLRTNHRTQPSRRTRGLYEHAAKSIAPEIFGALATGDRSPNRCQEHPAASKYPGISKERFENVRLCVFWAVVKKNIAVIVGLQVIFC